MTNLADILHELEKPEHHKPSIHEAGRVRTNDALDRLMKAIGRGLVTPIEQARSDDMFGADLRWWHDVVNNRRSARFTEKDLAPHEREGLAEMARAKAAKTRRPAGSLGHSDYSKAADGVKGAMGAHDYQVFDDGSTLNYEGPGETQYTPPVKGIVGTYPMKVVGPGGWKFRAERSSPGAAGTEGFVDQTSRPIRGADTADPPLGWSVRAWDIGHKIAPLAGAVPVSIASPALYDALPTDKKPSLAQLLLDQTGEEHQKR